ncbi:MAG: acyltransferase family protein [Leptolyngbyaceae cyanobacterium]
MVNKLKKHHIKELDGLRAIAAIAVLMFHSYIPIIGRYGWIGVPIFFVLSGFLVTGILLDSLEAENYYSAFYIRRGLRILPIYYLFLLVMYIPHVLWHPEKGNELFPVYAFYLQNIYGSGSFVKGAFNHTWTLAIETQFYFLWPLIVKTLRLKGILLVCPLLIVISIVLRALNVLTNVPIPLNISGMDQLCMGAFLAALIRTDFFYKNQSQFRLASLLLPILMIGSYLSITKLTSLTPIWVSGRPDFLFGVLLAPLVGVFVLIIISGWIPLLNIVLCVPPLLYIAKISYGLYLYHFPIFYLLIPHLSTYGFNIPARYLFIIQIIPTTCIAILSWHFIEDPINSLKRRFKYRMPQADAVR